MIYIYILYDIIWYQWHICGFFTDFWYFWCFCSRRSKSISRVSWEKRSRRRELLFSRRVVSQRTSCHWSSIAMIESWVSEAKNQGHHAVDHYLFSSMLEWIYIGCSLTSATVGKWISYENLFKRTRKLINVSHFLSCKNCALNRAVLVFPSVPKKSCSRSCSLVLPSVQKSCSRSCSLALPSVQKLCSKSCCFGVPLCAKIVL